MSRPFTEQQINVLIADYSSARDDERTLQATQAALFGVAVAITGLVAAVAAQTCAFTGEDVPCIEAPDPLLGLLPFAPLALVAFVLILGTAATIRSFYLRALEHEMQDVFDSPISSFVASDGSDTIRPPSYYSLLTHMISLRRGRRSYLILNITVFVAIMMIFGGLVYFIASKVNTKTIIGMVAVYGSLTCVMVKQSVDLTARGRATFVGLLDSYRNSDAVLSPLAIIRPSTGERTLFSYLLLPRPYDSVKWVFLPCAFGLGLWLSGEITGTGLWKALVLMVLLEYLIYEARYQWNDLRDYILDPNHPMAGIRGRLPRGRDRRESRRNLTVSVWVLVARILGGFSLATFVDLRYGLNVLVPFAILTLLVFSTAWVYEWLRGQSDRATDSSAAGWIPIGIWAWVGTGYAIRVGTGLWLGGIALTSTGFILSLPMMTAFGSMFVTLTWALEASSHCRREEVRENELIRAFWGPDLDRKKHLTALLPFTRPAFEFRSEIDRPDCGSFRILARNREKSLKSPWNIALVIAASLAVASQITLSQTSPDSNFAVVAAGTAFAAAGSVGLTATPGPAARWGMVMFVPAILAILSRLTGSEPLVASALLILLFNLTYAGFRSQSCEELNRNPFRLIQGLLGSLHLRLLILAAGRTTAAALLLETSSPPADPREVHGPRDATLPKLSEPLDT